MTHHPDFIVIGAMKCATTTLHNQLERQPGIYMASPKETSFFSDDEVYEQGFQWYQSLFDSAPTGALKGESSTHYTKLPTYRCTAKRMRHHIADTKLIYIVRHPIDRLVSQYIHEWSMRKISVSIDQAIAQHPELVAYSKYAMQLDPFLDAYDRQHILIVFFERLTREPSVEFERICRFIGYTSKPHWDTGQGAANVSSQRVRMSEVVDAMVNAPILARARRRFIPQSVRNWVKRRCSMDDRPALSPAVEQQLTEIFDPDLARLGRWLGIELSCKNFLEMALRSAYPWRDAPVSQVQSSQ